MNQEPYILFLKNDRPTLEQVRQTLTLSGYKVVCTTCNEQSLELIRNHKPDVLILDLTQPNCKSWELFHQIKADKSLAGIPIIDVSSRIPHGGRIILEDRLMPVFDLERILRSIAVLARKNKSAPTPAPE